MSKRDWSSDVCSSDLVVVLVRRDAELGVAVDGDDDRRESAVKQVSAADVKLEKFAFDFPEGDELGLAVKNPETFDRSEERRVGKEHKVRKTICQYTVS